MPKITILTNPPSGLPKRPVVQSRAVVGLDYAEIGARGRSFPLKWADGDGVTLSLQPDGSLMLELPSTTRQGRGGPAGQLISENVRRIRYVHRKNGLAYQHDFAAGVSLEIVGSRRGSVMRWRLFRPDGEPLYRFFPGVNR